MSPTFTSSPAPTALVPSSSMMKQKGHAVAIRVAPVDSASFERSSLTFVPTVSSIHIRAPPAPQHIPLVPLRGISTTSMPLIEPTTLRGARYTSLCRPR
jgi:hypothetical protein